MAQICKKKLGIVTVMSVTCIIIAGGIFGLMNSAVSDSSEAVAGATTIEAPVIGAKIGEASAPAPETASCDFHDWVGKSASEAEAAAKATHRAYRMLPPGSAMTMDYRADRINVELDGKGRDAKVTKVSCG